MAQPTDGQSDDAWIDGVELMTSQLADVLHTVPATISSWVRRHDEFPEPVPNSGRSPRYRLAEVLRWASSAEDRPRNLVAPRVRRIDLIWHSIEAKVEAPPDDGSPVRPLIRLVAATIGRELDDPAASELAAVLDPSPARDAGDDEPDRDWPLRGDVAVDHGAVRDGRELTRELVRAAIRSAVDEEGVDGRRAVALTFEAMMTSASRTRRGQDTRPTLTKAVRAAGDLAGILIADLASYEEPVTLVDPAAGECELVLRAAGALPLPRLGDDADAAANAARPLPLVDPDGRGPKVRALIGELDPHVRALGALRCLVHGLEVDAGEGPRDARTDPPSPTGPAVVVSEPPIATEVVSGSASRGDRRSVTDCYHWLKALADLADDGPPAVVALDASGLLAIDDHKTEVLGDGVLRELVLPDDPSVLLHDTQPRRFSGLRDVVVLAGGAEGWMWPTFGAALGSPDPASTSPGPDDLVVRHPLPRRDQDSSFDREPNPARWPVVPLPLTTLNGSVDLAEAIELALQDSATDPLAQLSSAGARVLRLSRELTKLATAAAKPYGRRDPEETRHRLMAAIESAVEELTDVRDRLEQG